MLRPHPKVLIKVASDCHLNPNHQFLSFPLQTPLEPRDGKLHTINFPSALLYYLNKTKPLDNPPLYLWHWGKTVQGQLVSPLRLSSWITNALQYYISYLVYPFIRN